MRPLWYTSSIVIHAKAESMSPQAQADEWIPAFAGMPI